MINVYNIRFKVKVEGTNKYTQMGCDPCAAVSCNAREIITRATDLAWRENANNGYVQDIIPLINNGLKKLREHPEEYVPYEGKRDNFATVHSTIKLFEAILYEWECCTECEDEEVLNVATFWIE